MEADVQVVEEGVLRILLTGVGVGEHSFASLPSKSLQNPASSIWQSSSKSSGM